MKKPRSSYRRPIIIVLVVIIVLILSGLFILNRATAPNSRAQRQAISLSQKYAGLKSYSQVYWTNLHKTYYTVDGTNKQNQAVYVVVPKKGGNLRVLKQKNGLTRNQVLQRVWQNRNPKKVLRASISIFNEKPAWVVTYLSQQGKLCYETIQFSNGKVLQKIVNI
ncbi:cell wall elongation regulator TseB-like domain-containing protein [Secundilactobacillus malefermentans]|nr:DUF5590 domain-containing protein [Secundilactobacillus malefermentans]KRM59289.1 hypothetical protein FD44_GL001928 [Secundilactobacillus malefermentans DSM 5705 = KCTC 3548]QEA32400.1 hypothetical protein FGL90_09540 [Secundilactobacillus malefermentans]